MNALPLFRSVFSAFVLLSWIWCDFPPPMSALPPFDSFVPGNNRFSAELSDRRGAEGLFHTQESRPTRLNTFPQRKTISCQDYRCAFFLAVIPAVYRREYNDFPKGKAMFCRRNRFFSTHNNPGKNCAHRQHTRLPWRRSEALTCQDRLFGRA
jgi:hypothetical protein